MRSKVLLVFKKILYLKKLNFKRCQIEQERFFAIQKSLKKTIGEIQKILDFDFQVSKSNQFVFLI